MRKCRMHTVKGFNPSTNLVLVLTVMLGAVLDAFGCFYAIAIVIFNSFLFTSCLALLSIKAKQLFFVQNL